MLCVIKMLLGGSGVLFGVCFALLVQAKEALPAGLSGAATSPEATSDQAVTLGRDLDGDGDPDEIHFRLEIIEVKEEVYPGKFVTSWVFAPMGKGMISKARLPSPTLRVEQGDRVKITIKNTHYFPHTIHMHGTIHPTQADGVPVITQAPVMPGESFTYEFIAQNPGTHWYHCHVQPDVHVPMGLAGMLIIEPNRPDNSFTNLVPGAGAMPDLSKAVLEAGYTQEYSLVYSEIDDRLNRIPELVSDPREIEFRMHRDFDTTQFKPNIFILNGRSFPYTLRDTTIDVRSGDKVKLRILNAGARTINLHIHGHHPILTHRDGYALPDQGYVRDVFTIGAAQRIDLELRPGSDDRYGSGPGVWLMHDHTETTVSNRGISPGGDLTVLVYEGFKEDSGLPKVATSLERFFDPDYYQGRVPVFDPSIFHSTQEGYTYGWPEDTDTEDLNYPRQNRETSSVQPQNVLDNHQIKANSCSKPRSFQRIKMTGGAKSAGEGEVYAFSPSLIRAERCQEIEIILENSDSVRHALMFPNLAPMPLLEFSGPDTRRFRFVTPDEDINLAFHCHVETHEKMGMHGVLIVGAGTPAKLPQTEAPKAENLKLFQGTGIVVSVDLRQGLVILDHRKIEGFMAAMTMSFKVTPPALLQGLEPGDNVRFVVDGNRREIIKIYLSHRGDHP